MNSYKVYSGETKHKEMRVKLLPKVMAFIKFTTVESMCKHKCMLIIFKNRLSPVWKTVTGGKRPHS